MMHNWDAYLFCKKVSLSGDDDVFDDEHYVDDEDDDEEEEEDEANRLLAAGAPTNQVPLKVWC